MDLGFYILLAAIIGSRLFFVLVNAGHYASHPLDILKIWEGGLVFYGGVLLAVPVTVWYVRKTGMDLWRTADIFAPSIAIGHVFGRLGCFAAGCCHGRAADDLPWGVTFTDPECLAPTNVPLHPTQLYESGGELLIFLTLLLVRTRKSFDGQLFMMYLILYAVLRFIVEFFRGDEGRGFILGGLSISQGISMLLLVTGMFGYALLKKKRPGR
jgi:phosphatidylglycerol:prolipoprotein diacylglycerol transferase